MATTTPLTDSPLGPAVKDYLSLYLAKIARLRCRELNSVEETDYDEFYEEFFLRKDLHARFHDQRRLIRNETIGRYLERNVPAGSSILDVGCGLGEVLDALPAGYQLSGLEYAKSNIAHAERLLGDRAKIVHGNIYDMDFPEGSQDVCTCLEVIEHIEDDARAIREIARVLKPGGVLLGSVPYTYYWPQYKQLIGHFRHYTRQSFTALCEENGLKVVEYLPNYPAWHHAYARQYCQVRATSLLFKWMNPKSSVYTFKWPWAKKTSIDKVADRLQSLQEADGKRDYSTLATSTFVAAQKPLS